MQANSNLDYNTVKKKQVISSRPIRRLLRGLYHWRGPGRKPYNPISMLKVQFLKNLLRVLVETIISKVTSLG
jgi:hypothetical protein